MTLDATAVEALAIDAARSMSDGLKMLAQKEANEAIKQERLRLAEEARRLEDIRLQLDEERKRLDQGFGRLSDDRGALEVSDSLPGSLSPIRRQTRDEPGSPLDIEADAGAGPGIPMSLPATAPGTQATVEDCQGTLTRCADEALVSVLTGRRTSLEVAGNGGRVLVDMRPSALLPLLERLDDGYQGEAGVSCEKRLKYLLEKFGLQGFIYQDVARNLQVESLLSFRGCRYTVLPPAGPREASVLLDMYDVTVTVPPGWEVLSTDHQGFDDAIQQLSRHGWGTSLLCVKNAEDGFSSFRTVLYTHGGRPAGTCVSSDSRVLQAVNNCGCQEQFKFSKGMVLSGRLVICSSKSQ